jgi:uracil-DNA glycosylase
MHKSWKSLFDKYETLYNEQFMENVYPPKELIFRVFEMDVKEIKILLLGQDPYHQKGQAHGLSFSVPNNIKIPPSLRNIFKELLLEFPDRKYNFTHGNLERWFYEEKIFLLNASLTVEDNKPNSHAKLWSKFTDDVIEFISYNNPNCLFLLLGNFAKNKSKFICNKNLIVDASHPSPLAQGFIGSNVFKQIETKLNQEINWQN